MGCRAEACLYAAKGAPGAALHNVKIFSKEQEFTAPQSKGHGEQTRTRSLGLRTRTVTFKPCHDDL
jgi:hypothetical protein